MAQTYKHDKLGDLPRWDLSDMYNGVDDPQIAKDLDAGNQWAEGFAKKYQGKIDSLSGDELAAAIKDYEGFRGRVGKLMNFMSLSRSLNLTDEKVGTASQNASERMSQISNKLIFWHLEIAKLDQKVLDQQLASSPDLKHYLPWLREVRVFKDHVLSPELEKLMSDQSVVTGSWVRLFDEAQSRLRFKIEGKEVSLNEAINCLYSPNESLREEAGHEISRVFSENGWLFAKITNALAKDKGIDDEWRGYPRGESMMNLNNQVEDEVVDALVDSVKQSYSSLSHRYYALKAKWLGKTKLAHWDRAAPLPETKEEKIPWDEAKQIVLDAYNEFSPEIGKIVQMFFDNSWIDAPMLPEKDSGAYSSSGVAADHPRVFMNYQGKPEDVMTLAHELGHGAHQWLARKQGDLMSGTPLTLAETASVFGEMLTFKSLLARETDPVRRKALIANKVESMLATAVRQISFHDYETKVHSERKEGELSTSRLNEIWLEVAEESLGPSFDLDKEYGNWWAYIPHFIHVPFYVYAYAFGECLVNSLHACYENAPQGFADKYIDMLEAGGTKRHKELLAPFGLDLKDPTFWKRGLQTIEKLIDELERLDKADHDIRKSKSSCGKGRGTDPRPQL